VLLGKALDFTTHWASGPAFDSGVRLIAIDPEAALVERAANEKGERFLLGCIADTRNAAETLIVRAAMARARRPDWLIDARAALDHRPAAWANVVAKSAGRLHPTEVFRTLRPYIERNADTVLICDGGEFAQWGQSMLPVRRRLPFVAVLGNDACWNAETQIQLRDYGRERMHGCELLPSRYDQVVAGLGGHGEFVENAADLPGAIERALVSGKPACINIMVESIAAPVVHRGG
jgi:acetolactate synthase-1/2/3 large subunit